MLLPISARIVTDSNAMLPAALSARYGILTVPLTIVVDGQATHEDEVDLVDFYDHLRAGKTISTSAPSPGEVLAAYRQAIEEGASEILSIHVGANQSATLSAARLAAAEVEVPVTLVDTGSASFIEGCCVWRAAEIIAEGGRAPEATEAAEGVARTAQSVFAIGEIARAASSGRLDVPEGAGAPIFASAGAEMFELCRATTEADAVAAMVERVGGARGPLRVGVGHADAPEAAAALEAALRSLPDIAEIVRYLVGPSVAAHTGAGTFGVVYHSI